MIEYTVLAHLKEERRPEMAKRSVRKAKKAVGRGKNLSIILAAVVVVAMAVTIVWQQQKAEQKIEGNSLQAWPLPPVPAKILAFKGK